MGVYLNALHNPFVFDDGTEILENPSIRNLGNLEGVLRYNLSRPLTNLSYAFDYALWSLNPFGYHLTNLVLHVANVVLLFWLVGGLARDGWLEPTRRGRLATFAAFTAASLFAVHPMMTEAVGYVSGRAELLCATLLLTSFHAFRIALLGGAGAWFAGGGVLWLLALSAKESAVMLPPLLLAYDILILKGPGEARRRRIWRVHVPLLVVVLGAAAARVWLYISVEHAAAGGIQWQNLLVNVEVAARYLSLLVAPVSQSIVQPVYPIQSVVDARVLIAASALAVAGAAAMAWRRREPLLTFGLAWFFLLLIPSAALIVLADRGQPMAEHRVYIASCGFFVAAGASIQHLFGLTTKPRSSRIAWAAAMLAAALVVLGILTLARNRVWSDPVRLWEDAARKAPLTYVSHYGVGDAYRQIGDCASAGPAYERAIAIRPDSANAYLGLAECLRDSQKRDDARAVLRAGINRAPPDVRLLLALATLEESRQNVTEARRLCADAMHLSPGNPAAARCLSRNEPGRLGGP